MLYQKPCFLPAVEVFELDPHALVYSVYSVCSVYSVSCLLVCLVMPQGGRASGYRHQASGFGNINNVIASRASEDPILSLPLP